MPCLLARGPAHSPAAACHGAWTSWRSILIPAAPVIKIGRPALQQTASRAWCQVQVASRWSTGGLCQPADQALGSAGQIEPPVRVRAFPHVEGNYATYVFTEGGRCAWQTARHALHRPKPPVRVAVDVSEAVAARLQAAVRQAAARAPGLQLHDFLQQARAPAAHLWQAGCACETALAGQQPGSATRARLSLSRTVALRFPQIEPLVQQLQLALSPTRR